MIKFIELFAGIGGFRYGLERVQFANENLCQPTTATGDTTGQLEQLNNISNKGLFNYGLESVDRNPNRRGKANPPGEPETRQGLESSQRKGVENEGGRYGKQSNSNADSRAFTCVYANEWNEYAARIYEKNFGSKPDTRDITTINVRDIPDHDLLTGGFPCQTFSIAGKRKGFEDTRGTLFFEIARILATKRPRYLLLENVAGLLSHDRGRTFQVILATLNELGYDLQWQVLNSKNFGVPQNRERVFIIGHLRRQLRPEVFPIREEYCISSESGRPGQAKNQLATAITSNLKRGVHSGGETLINVIGNLETETWKKRYESNRRVYGSDGIYPTIPTGTGSGIMPKIGTGLRIRRLTPTECERLQGFPDNWTKYGIDQNGKTIQISDSQRYKVLGNAVTTTVIKVIGERLLTSIYATNHQ